VIKARTEQQQFRILCSILVLGGISHSHILRENGTKGHVLVQIDIYRVYKCEHSNT
jgi:hypothetical protein